MSSEHHHLVIPHHGPSSILGLNALFFGFAVAAVSAFCVFPGGLAWVLSRLRSPRTAAAIPGPSGFPLLGLVFTFSGTLAHRVLAKLAATFEATSLMAFSIGLTRFVIASRPEPAREILGSSAFADRPVKESAYELLFHRAMGFAPYGDYWRNLRRISATHLFSPKRISGFSDIRKEIGLGMVSQIRASMEKTGGVGGVEVRKVLHFGSLNNVMTSVFGKRYDFVHHGGDGAEAVLEGLVSEGYDLLGAFNWSDHFPLLGWLDLQGVRKRCRNLVSRVNVFVGKIIEEHRAKRSSAGSCGDEDATGDFVDVLLDLEGENNLSNSDMIAVLWEMIFRGTDTVAILLEWIMARMVLHQDIQAQVQSEIDSVVGGRPVADSDLSRLPFLSAVVKETLRVHPPGPLLSWARLAIHDTLVDGRFVPAGTTAMVNMWAITHDGGIWAEPGEFRPQRFMEEDVAVMGSDLRLAPFGSGRRVCPGKALGMATVQLWLAQLLQNFKWAPSDSGSVDLAECLKLSLEMKRPLVCKAVPRARVF